MKMDKEWILKQRFWLLLGTFGLLWFVCLIALVVIGGGPVEAAKKTFDDATTLIKPYTAGSGPSRPKNDSFLPKWVEYGNTFNKHKITVWGIAWYGDKPKPDDPPGKILWTGQGGMYVWPTTERYENGVLVAAGDHALNQLLFNAASPFEVKHRQWYKGNDNFSPYRNQFSVLYYDLRSTADEARADSPAPPQKPLDPASFKGDFLSVMKPVDINSEAVTNAPDTEECWLMQEDFWVRAEVLRVVADAMNMAGHMNPVDAPADKAADPNILGQRTFHNDSWEVTLRFDQGGQDANGSPMWRVRPDSTIKNVHVSHRDQELGSPALNNGGEWFRLRLGNAISKIAFEGAPVPWDQTRSLADGKYKDGWLLKGNPDLSKPVALEQVFDATNTPVTEIGEIAIPKVSHKNANRLLIAAKPERYGQKPPPPPDAKAPGAGGAPGSPPAPGGPPGPNGTGGSSLSGPPPGIASAGGGLQGMGMGSGTQTAANLTPNYKIDRNRYLFVTEQSRHLPIAVTLTVDQSHLYEVLAAFANSRLRFQTTQVEFRRVPSAAPSSGSTQPGSAFPGPGSAFPGPGGTGGPPFPGGTSNGPSSLGGPPAGGTSTGPSSLSGPPSGGTGGSSRGGPPMPNGLNPGGAAGSPAAAVVENPNLIEVTIYGVASLYERPPDAK